MNSRTTCLQLLILLVFISLPARAELNYAEYEQLDPLPDQILNLPLKQRLRWLKESVVKATSPVEIYRLNRQLFYEFYWLDNRVEAIKHCELAKPLRKDYFYRENCSQVLHPDYQDYLPRILAIIYDARQSQDLAAAAELLNNLAWRQSQSGNIASSYENYEAALAIVPSTDRLLLSTIMMDSATNYIIHGDSRYVEKGIELLAKARQENLQALATETRPDIRDLHQDNILLTYFNTGVAYTLHLYDYERAVTSYQPVIQSNNPYRNSALTFSAFAAAKLSQYDTAKSYLKLLGDAKDEQKIVEEYLNCYRQMTIYHWNKNQTLASCLTLDPSTTIEVQLDVYKRLAMYKESKISTAGMKKLTELFLSKIEPQLKIRGASAASNTEIRRLQRESELKSLVLEQQKQLQLERETAHTNRQKYFAALFVILLSFMLLIISQLRQKKKLADQYQRMSTRDSLTQLGNRRFLEQQIERELAFVDREIKSHPDIALGIYLFDIDHFKKINDTYGHQVGDEVLQEISRRIKKVTRNTDLFVRWGGEEFLFVARLDSEERTYHVANRILTAVNRTPFAVGAATPIPVTCTLGVVKYPFIESSNNHNWTRLVSLADMALYYGKNNQRDCWVSINNHTLTKAQDIDRVLSHSIEQAVSEHWISLQSSLDR